MIMIYSTDETGKLYTDEKKRFYLDGELLREKARAVRIEYLMNRIAKVAGYKSFSEMETFLRATGVTNEVLDSWLLSGKLIENLV